MNEVDLCRAMSSSPGLHKAVWQLVQLTFQGFAPIATIVLDYLASIDILLEPISDYSAMFHHGMPRATPLLMESVSIQMHVDAFFKLVAKRLGRQESFLSLMFAGKWMRRGTVETIFDLGIRNESTIVLGH